MRHAPPDRPGVGASRASLLPAVLALLLVAADGPEPGPPIRPVPPPAPEAPAAAIPPPVDPALAPLLARMDRAARLYSDAALKFTCDETLVTDKGTSYHFEYIYVLSADGRFHDYRTRRGDKGGAEIAPDSIRLKQWLAQAYSWVFLFRSDRRSHVRTWRVGSGTALGAPATRVGFEPIPPIDKELNYWTGTAWVDPATGQILRVEAQGADDLDANRAFAAAIAEAPPVIGQGAARAPQSFYVGSVTTEFGVATHGMRLPSRATVEIRRSDVPGRGGRSFDAKVIYRLTQTYRNYRFFAARAEEKAGN